MFQEFPDNEKNEDFLNDFRQKIAQQSTVSFQEKKEELNRSKNVLIGAVSGVVLAGIVGWIALAPRYSQTNNVDIPVIRRPQTAIKVQPIEPGGMEIANQDKSIYDIIEKKVDDTNATVESILPPPEEAILPVIQAKPESIENIIAEAEEKTVITTAPIAEVKEEAKIETTIVSPAPVAVAVETVKIPAPVKISTSATSAATTGSEFDEDDTTIASTKPASKGQWQIQLMSSPNKQAVEKEKASIIKKYIPLAMQVLEVETADLQAKGIYYRLNAGAFATKAEADKLCKDIKALGANCFAKKK